jgi:hypothetical protein
VFKRFPFTIILKNREGGELQPIALKIDPGSKETGIVMVGDFKRGKRVIWAGVLEPRGQQVKNAIEIRRTLRRGRRAVNATRWALYNCLKNSGLPIEVGTGGRTKFNRTRQGYPKAHWIDASCIGESGICVYLEPNMSYLHIKATGHGSRQMCGTDKFGFPIRHRLRQKRHFGFQTGDMVKAVVIKGKYVGVHVGRVACRATGSFDITTKAGKVTVNYKNCSILHRADGYSYAYQRKEWHSSVS